MLRRVAFDIWYLFRPPWDSGISPPELYEFMQRNTPGRAIDLGCGTGTNVIALARHGWQVTGVDYSPRAIRIARRKVLQARVAATLSVGDVTRLQGVRGPFDLALDIGCFHMLENRIAYLSSLLQILAPNGHWLMYGFVEMDSARRRRGISAADLALIRAHDLQLLYRKDGTDKGARPSAWFLHWRPANQP